VPLALGHAPAGRDGHDVAEAERVGGVVHEVRFGVVEELGSWTGFVSTVWW
jgi:hypothetical protein